MRALLLLQLAAGCNHQLPLEAEDLGDLAVADLTGGCRSASECGSFEICLPPGEFAGCGECLGVSACQSDSDCTADGGTYPEWGPTCDAPNSYRICVGCFTPKACLRGCDDDSDCLGGRKCDATRHCVVRSCSGGGDCPSQFDCQGGQCVRISCSGDTQCPGGVCVGGSCYPGFGTCMVGPV